MPMLLLLSLCVFSSFVGITLGDYPKYQGDSYHRAKELAKVIQKMSLQKEPKTYFSSFFVEFEIIHSY